MRFGDSLKFELYSARRHVDHMESHELSQQAGIAAVRDEIARACRDAGAIRRPSRSLRYRRHSRAEAIEPVIAAGQRVFGENRVQEAKAKWPPLIARHSGIELHLVGSLQSNKARDAVALFDAIHSVDRASLAEALGKEIAEQSRAPAAVCRDQYRRRAAKGRRAAAGRRRFPRRLPRPLWARRFPA